jgi:hypothetical protein
MADERDIKHFDKMANDNKQTAVEYLFEQLWETPKDKFTWNTILSKAKEMEKEQIMEAHNEGYADGYRDNGNSPIDYYNKTYKSE